MPITHQYRSPEQLALLLKKHGLLFNSEVFVTEKLRRIGYNRLRLYLYPFLAAPKEEMRYKPNSRFRDALELYEFDQELRNLAFNEISKIEVAVRNAMADIITQETDNMFWMTDASIYANEELFNKTMTGVNKKLQKTREDNVAHFCHEYDTPHPPAYLLAEFLPMGVINQIYANLADNRLRKKVAAEFSLTVPVFRSWCTAVALTRNACCHHERMWNKEYAIPPMQPKRMKLPWISLTVPPKRIFYNLCIIKYFVNIIDKDNNMTIDLGKLLLHHSHIDTAAMGIPDKWNEEPLWKV